MDKSVLCSSDIQVHGCTDKGSVRPHNEDYYGHYIPTDANIRDKLGSLFAISDGVGGYQAGEVASAEAVNVLLQEYYFSGHSEKVSERLKAAFQRASMHIYDLANSHSMLNNMQCTLSALLIRNEKFYIAHVGDSKIFLLRSNKLMQITKDHSLVGRLVRLGLVTPEAARTHPNKNILLRALGESPILLADMYSGNTMPGDIFCLVTDGILEHLEERELKEFLLVEGYESEKLNKLINIINERGGYDNMTIITVKTDKW